MSRHFAASFVESNNLENLASAFGMISISLFVPEIDVLPINSNHLVRPTMVNVGVSSFVAVNWRIVGVLHFLPLYVLGFVYQCKKA